MNATTEKLKIGHQAPQGFRINRFNSIEILGDYAYCASHNFIFNSDDEKRKLYDGQPCYYTDSRFIDGNYNFYRNAQIHWTRWKDISLRACIRKTLRVRNIPVGTIVSFNKSWYYAKRRIDLSYKFKIKKENKLDVEYEVNLPGYSQQFNSCEFSKKLTDALRANGFIVDVMTNSSFLLDMVNNAATYTGQGEPVDSSLPGEVAVAYGHGKKIGFSSRDSDLFGYGQGCKNILWDRFGEFDKWSRCCEIPKDTSVEEIIKTLMEPNPIVEDE